MAAVTVWEACSGPSRRIAMISWNPQPVRWRDAAAASCGVVGRMMGVFLLTVVVVVVGWFGSS